MKNGSFDGKINCASFTQHSRSSSRILMNLLPHFYQHLCSTGRNLSFLPFKPISKCSEGCLICCPLFHGLPVTLSQPFQVFTFLHQLEKSPKFTCSFLSRLLTRLYFIVIDFFLLISRFHISSVFK